MITSAAYPFPNERTNPYLSMLPRYRIAQVAALFFFVVVCTLQAQNPEPTPTPAPAPACETCEVVNQLIYTRRLIVLFAGMWIGWNACTLIYSRIG
jgi:hypothetical protein